MGGASVQVTFPSWILLSVAVVLVCLWLTTIPIRLGVTFGKPEEIEYVRVSLSFGRLSVAFRAKVARLLDWSRSMRSSSATAGKRDGQKKPKGGAVVSVRAPMRLFRTLFRRVESFEWRTEIGTGDAALTAWVMGGLWTLKSTVIGSLNQHLDFLSRPLLQIVPNWETSHLTFEVRCIFRFTLGEIILATLLRRPPMSKRG